MHNITGTHSNQKLRKLIIQTITISYLLFSCGTFGDVYIVGYSTKCYNIVAIIQHKWRNQGGRGAKEASAPLAKSPIENLTKKYIV